MVEYLQIPITIGYTAAASDRTAHAKLMASPGTYWVVEAVTFVPDITQTQHASNGVTWALSYASDGTVASLDPATPDHSTLTGDDGTLTVGVTPASAPFQSLVGKRLAVGALFRLTTTSAASGVAYSGTVNIALRRVP